MEKSITEVKHTPGPWAWAGESYRDASGSQEDAIVICTDKGETVAVIHDAYNETVAATAELIAAAPEMYRVLGELHEWFTTFRDDLIADHYGEAEDGAIDHIIGELETTLTAAGSDIAALAAQEDTVQQSEPSTRLTGDH